MMNSIIDDIIKRLEIYRNNAISISDFIYDKKSTTAIELTQITKDIDSIINYLYNKDSIEIEQLIFNLLKSKLTEQSNITTQTNIETDKDTYNPTILLKPNTFSNNIKIDRCELCNIKQNSLIHTTENTFICLSCRNSLDSMKNQ